MTACVTQAHANIPNQTHIYWNMTVLEKKQGSERPWEETRKSEKIRQMEKWKVERRVGEGGWMCETGNRTFGAFKK